MISKKDNDALEKIVLFQPKSSEITEVASVNLYKKDIHCSNTFRLK